MHPPSCGHILCVSVFTYTIQRFHALLGHKHRWILNQSHKRTLQCHPSSLTNLVLHIHWYSSLVIYTKKVCLTLTTCSPWENLHRYTLNVPMNLMTWYTVLSAGPTTSKLHQMTFKSCNIFQLCKGSHHYGEQPYRYRKMLPDECVFNYSVAIEVMFINSVPILRAVLWLTHFSFACFLQKKNLYHLLTTLMTTWVPSWACALCKIWSEESKSILPQQFKIFASPLQSNLMETAFIARCSLITD